MLCKKNGGLFAIAIAVTIACIVANSSKAETFEGIAINTQGSGPAMVFIPGLNSSTDTFTNTCAYFHKKHECHLLHLPGFAGQAALTSNNEYLLGMRDRIERYLKAKKLSKVILVGHSLGGELSLMIAIDAPELIDKIVIVEALPFYSALQNPKLTAELVRPQAEQMRQAMNNQTTDDYMKNATSNLYAMSNNPKYMPLLIEWTKTSDRATTTQAMYELMTTDLRASIATIKQPTLVLGAWAAYKSYGSTKESTKLIYSTQYAKLKNVDIRMSENGFHFLTWDDGEWVNQQIAEFISH